MRREISWMSFVASLASLALVGVLERAVGSAQEGGTGTLTGRVSWVDDGRLGDHSQVVVYVDGASRDVPRAARVTKEIRQRDLRFTQEFVAIPRGSTVEFPNDDRVFHNVFSLSRTKRFDLGLYREGESRSVTFDRPGTVDVYCNIHPDMIAQIMVLPSPHFAVTTAGGGYVIPDVPAGTWEVVAAARHGEAYRGQVTISARRTATHDVRVRAGERPSSHRRKDGSPYGRYR